MRAFSHLKLCQSVVVALVFALMAGLWSVAVTAQTRTLTLPLETEWKPVAPAGSLATSGTVTWADARAPELKEAKPAESDLTSSPALTGGLLSVQDRLSVGVGDQIYVTVFGQPDMSAEVTVNDNEQVTLSLIGTLKVGGLPPQAIEKLIAQRLREGEYLRNPQVSVQVRQVRSQMISVLGEVVRPGRYPILGKLTVLEALATAGGLGPRADKVVSLLRRNVTKGEGAERQEIPIRLDQLVGAGRGDLDVELRNDDVVFVGQQRQFYVYGEVRRPGAYPMEPDLNVMRVLSISGGVTERGSLRRIRISRKGADQIIQEFKPDLNTPILSGDVVFVDERLF